MKTDLLQMVENGGCSAKISPQMLEEFLRYLRCLRIKCPCDIARMMMPVLQGK